MTKQYHDKLIDRYIHNFKDILFKALEEESWQRKGKAYETYLSNKYIKFNLIFVG